MAAIGVARGGMGRVLPPSWKKNIYKNIYINKKIYIKKYLSYLLLPLQKFWRRLWWRPQVVCGLDSPDLEYIYHAWFPEKLPRATLTTIADSVESKSHTKVTIIPFASCSTLNWWLWRSKGLLVSWSFSRSILELCAGIFNKFCSRIVSITFWFNKILSRVL